MYLDLSCSANEKVIAYLRRPGGRGDAPPVALPESVDMPHYTLGSHPDIVARLWDELNRALPADCSVIVFGTPAVVEPESGIVLALGAGTAYLLRLPADAVGEAVKRGARTVMKWSGGGEMDARMALGDDWVFGAWLDEEPAWCRRVYEAARRSRREKPAPPHEG